MGAMMKAVVIIMTFFFLSACFQERGLFLVANGVVPVYETPEKAMSELPREKINTLSSQQRVRVLKCIDVKHYQIYKIRFLDGNLGYVNEGDYVLLRKGKPSYC